MEDFLPLGTDASFSTDIKYMSGWVLDIQDQRTRLSGSRRDARGRCITNGTSSKTEGNAANARIAGVALQQWLPEDKQYKHLQEYSTYTSWTTLKRNTPPHDLRQACRPISARSVRQAFCMGCRSSRGGISRRGCTKDTYNSNSTGSRCDCTS